MLTGKRPPVIPARDAKVGAGTRLRGRQLLVARAACILLISLSLGMFTAALPARLVELRGVATQAWQSFRHLSPAGQQAILGLGINLAGALDRYPIAALGLEIGLMLLFLASTLVIVRHRSDDWMALFVAAALVAYGAFVIPPLDALMAAQPVWKLPGNLLQALGVTCALLFFYIFPDGRFTPGWTRGLIAAWGIWALAWVLFPASTLNLSNPFSLSFLWFLMLMLWWSTGLFAQIYRYWRVSNPVQRQQTKYIVFGVIIAVFGYGLYAPARFILPWVDPTGLAALFYQLFGIPLFLLCVFSVPLTITFSILRYRLWDIDLFINRAMVYAALSAALALGYVGSVLLLQWLFHALTGEEQSEIVTAVSTLAIAATFQPVRRRIQDFVDRRFYRRKVEAEQLLAAFSASARDEVDLARLTDALLGVIDKTLSPAHVSLWMPTTPAAKEDWYHRTSDY
jgi:hypothetical protein